jgi:zinc transporter
MAASESPFLHAYLLDGRGGGEELSAAAVSQWRPEDGLLWVHLDVNEPRARRWILDDAGLDPLHAEALLAAETRPRTVVDERGLLVNLRGVNTNPGADPEDMVSIRIRLERDRIITTRRRILLSVQDVRAAIAAGSGPKTGGEFLVLLIEHLASRIGVVVEQIDEDIDAIEARAAVGKGRVAPSELAEIRRQTAAIRRYLAPQRDALTRLIGDVPWLTRADQDEVRELTDRNTRYIEELDLARERTIMAQEELLSRLAHEQNSRLYVLSVVAAIFLPLSFITGLLGMNVAGLPGTEDPIAFAVSAIAMGVLAAALIAVFKWKKWI